MIARTAEGSRAAFQAACMLISTDFFVIIAATQIMQSA